MKRYQFLSIAFLVILHQNVRSQETARPRLVEITFLDWSMVSMVPIPCDALRPEANLGLDGRILILEGEVFFSQIALEMKTLTQIDSPGRPDVRIRAVISYENKPTRVVCVGIEETMTLDGHPVKYQRSLEVLLRSVIPSN